MAAFHAVAFGLRWSSDIPLYSFTPAPAGPADIIVERATGPIAPRPATYTRESGAVFADGFRYVADSFATFDCYDGNRLIWWPGPDWYGTPPRHLFSSIAALVMAWRGALPLHATAVELDGRAVLLCGRSGAGKSTLAAGLVARGARLISDDLTVVAPFYDGEQPVVRTGRPTVRLFPATAAYLRDLAPDASTELEEGKVKLPLPATPPLAAIPVAAVVLLEDTILPPSRIAAELRAHLFRPRWMAQIPGQRDRLAMLHRLAGAVPLTAIRPAEVRDEAAFWRQADDSAATLRGLIG